MVRCSDTALAQDAYRRSVKNSLLVSDLHLTSAPRDEYRWSVFNLLQEDVGGEVRHIWILGDLTDAKDNHNAQLVNRICDAIGALAKEAEVHIVRGNHDGSDPAWPYFRFLRAMNNVHFYIKPGEAHGQRNVLVLPHSRNPEKDWAQLADPQSAGYKWVMMHATFTGSISESGVEIGDLEIPNQLRRKDVKIYSGDVHVPQKLGNVTYVGSPHHVHYGDSFKPRMIYIDNAGKEESINLPYVPRLMYDIKNLRDLQRLAPSKGAQAKVRLHLTEADLGKWQELRKAVVQECKKLGLDLASVELVREKEDRPLLRDLRANVNTARDVLEDFLHRTPYAAIEGRQLLEQVQKGK